MRIVMMTNTYAPIVGGLEKSIQSFSAALRKRGHQVKIVAPAFDQSSADEKDIIRVPAIQKINGTDFSMSLPVSGSVTELFEIFRPEIVHAHHPFLLGDMAMRLCGQYKVPLVFTYHTMFEWYTNYFGLKHESVQRFVVELAAGYANLCDQVIVPSESIAKVLKKRRVKTRIDIVPTGVNISQFSTGDSKIWRKKLKIPASAFVVGHLGRLSAEKNLLFLARGIADFLKKKSQSHCIIIGEGDSKPRLEKMMLKSGVDKRVHFTGGLKGKNLVDAYHAMSVFGFASKSETQGMVITEAMAAGLPVVALDASGAREVVHDFINGRLLKTHNPSDFTRALIWCESKDKAAYKKLKLAARATAEEFSVEKSTEKILKVYSRIKLKNEKENHGSETDWSELLGRIKTEWTMLANMGHAVTSAVAGAVGISSEIKTELAANK